MIESSKNEIEILSESSDHVDMVRLQLKIKLN